MRMCGGVTPRSLPKIKNKRPSSLSWNAALLAFLYIQAQFFTPSFARRLNEKSSSSTTSNEKDLNGFTSESLSSSSNIPPVEETIELARFSSLVYGFRPKGAQDCSSFPPIYKEYKTAEREMYGFEETNDHEVTTPSDLDSNDSPNSIDDDKFTYKCLMYERDNQDTQVLIVSRTLKNSADVSSSSSSTDIKSEDQNYLAVVFAGTDDFRNALTDSNILSQNFGPEVYHDDDQIDPNRQYNFPSIEENIIVHRGFNNAVFKHGLFDRIYDVVVEYQQNMLSIQNSDPSSNTTTPFKIFTTGHSLGASDSILTAVALKLQTPFLNQDIHSINFGCPKTGSHKWKKFVNGIDGLGIWRVVNGKDLVPRMPGIRFHHVGHTVQLESKDVKGYWLHNGDKKLGYKGVPFGWNGECIAACMA